MKSRAIMASASVVALAMASTPAVAQDDNDEDVIVVRGIRGSLSESLDIKRESTQIVDSIVAEDIGKFPDNNVVEALQRVTGVQVTDRQAGEASGITIRGLPDTTTTWNGRRVFTAAGGAIALTDIPATMVSRVDVYKTRTADQIPTGLAGQINIVTRRPFDFDGLKVSGQVRGTYLEQAESFDPSVSALLSNNWDTDIGRFGALVNLSYTETEYRDQLLTAGAMIPFAVVEDENNFNYGPLERIFPDRGGFVGSPGSTADNPNPPIWQPGLETGLPSAAGSFLEFYTAGTQDLAGTAEYYLSRDAVIAVDTEAMRERPAANVVLQFEPIEGAGTYTAEYFYQGYRNTVFNNLHFMFADWWGELGPSPNDTFNVYEGTNIISDRSVGFPGGFQSGDIVEDQTDTHAFALNGEWDLLDDRLNLVADLSYQTSEFETRFLAQRSEYINVPRGLTVDFNSGDGVPSWMITEIAAGANPTTGTDNNAYIANPANYRPGELFDNVGRDRGEAITFSADADYDLGWGDEKPWKQLQLGFRWDERGVETSSFENRGLGAIQLTAPYTAFDEGLQYYNEDFYDGQADVPSTWVVSSGYYLLDNGDAVRSIYRDVGPGDWTGDGDPNRPVLLSGEKPYLNGLDVTETTTELYGLLDMEFMISEMPLFIQVGARYVDVRTELEYGDLDAWYAEFLAGTDSSPLPSLTYTNADVSTDDLLPSVVVNFEPTEDLLLRFNYGETLRRPGFGSLNPNRALTDDLSNTGFGTGSAGNPNLEATRGKNYDLSAEYYFGEDDAIYATLFRRDVEGLVVNLRTVQTFTAPGFDATRWVINQPVNASDGVLQGAELGAVFFPDNLPPVLDGLGFIGSLTLLDSEQNIPITDETGAIVDERNDEFFGVSDISYNTTLAYENDLFGARLSYVWREEFKLGNEAAQFANPLGIWRTPDESLDFSANVNLGERVSLSFDAVNLTEEKTQDYYRFENVGNPDTHNFRNWLVSRSFSVTLRAEY